MELGHTQKTLRGFQPPMPVCRPLRGGGGAARSFSATEFLRPKIKILAQPLTIIKLIINHLQHNSGLGT